MFVALKKWKQLLSRITAIEKDVQMIKEHLKYGTKIKF